MKTLALQTFKNDEVISIPIIQHKFILGYDSAAAHFETLLEAGYIKKGQGHSISTFIGAPSQSVSSTIIENKIDLVVSLLKELEDDFNQKAELVKDVDLPLYRMLTEGGSSYFKEMYKGLHTSGQIDTLKARLKAADKILNNK